MDNRAGPDEGPPGGSGIKFEHNFNGATIVSNESLNANVAGTAFSGNSANFNSSKSNSCAGICVVGNKISGQQQGGYQKPPVRDFGCQTVSYSFGVRIIPGALFFSGPVRWCLPRPVFDFA